MMGNKFFNRINHAINYLYHALIAVLMHISFVLYYRYTGNECPEMGAGCRRCPQMHPQAFRTSADRLKHNFTCSCGSRQPDTDASF